MNWTAIVIIICAIVAAIKLWMEYRRVNRSRLLLRLVATLLAVIALACIALPISFNSKTETGINDGVLLTNGFDKDSISRYRNGKRFTTDMAIQKANPKLNIALAADPGDFASKKISIAGMHVLGYGLTGDELKQLNHYPIIFHPAAAPPGIVSVSWDKTVKAGEALHVQGTFAGDGKANLILQGLNTRLDSAVVNSGSSFSLKAIPKNIGRGVYNLFVINGKDTIEKENVPFEVLPIKPLKVLMLSTSPDFETKFLKDWLTRHGYGVVVRTAISKDKFSREYFNMPQVPVDVLNPGLLEKFDLVIGDLSTFKGFSAAENGALQMQMAQKGLGVVIKADSAGKGASFLTNAFPMDRMADKNMKATRLFINGQNTLSAKLVLDAAFIKPQPGTQPLVSDQKGHTAVSSTIYGSGKIVFTNLNNTFNWALAGDEGDYTSLWSMLIGKAARRSPEGQKWGTTPLLPVVNEPVTLTVDGPSALPVQIKAGATNIAFAQNPVLPFSWEATYWPEAYGWQKVTQNGSPVYCWYAFGNNDWLSLRAVATIAATQKYADANKVKGTTMVSHENAVSVPVPKIWFYLLLLFSCTYLWVEAKL